MLKIYRCRNEFKLFDGKRTIKLKTSSHTVIKDEAAAVDCVTEIGAYTNDAEKAYFPDCYLHQKRKGIQAEYWHYDGCVVAKEWLSPNVKLIRHSTYTEYSCSMTDLMKLPAQDVIAYLKQEGIGLVTPS